MSDRRGDPLRLGDILQSIERLEEVLALGYEHFQGSWLSQSATIRELEVIGEASGAISSYLRDKHPEISWKKMRGFSSFSKHEYWRIIPEEVWKTLEEMPELRKKVGQVVARSD